MTLDPTKVFEDAYEMSKILKTGLDRETLARCMSLIEQGVNPEGLAMVIRDLKSNK